jgi:uncharacterized protein (DUF433 family)
MKSNELITVDPNILGGTPVFKGTRVPVKTLFEYFPSVTRGMACGVLECSESALLTPATA